MSGTTPDEPGYRAAVVRIDFHTGSIVTLPDCYVGGIST